MAEPTADRLVYLDANSLIYFVEGEPAVSAAMRPLFDALRAKPGAAITSELTLAEVLAPPRRESAWPLEAKRQPYMDLLVRSGFIHLEPVSRDVLIETAEMRKAFRLRLADAIHVATAARNRCRYFVSGDAGLAEMPSGMVRIGPADGAFAPILSELTQ